MGGFRSGLVSRGSVGPVVCWCSVGFAASTWRTTCGPTTHLRPPLTATWCPSAASSMRSLERMSPLGRFVLKRWLTGGLHEKHWLQMHCYVNFFQVFKRAPAHFPHFFKCVMESCLSGEQLGLSLKEQTVLLLFLDHCFNSLVNNQSSAIVNNLLYLH